MPESRSLFSRGIHQTNPTTFSEGCGSEWYVVRVSLGYSPAARPVTRNIPVGHSFGARSALCTTCPRQQRTQLPKHLLTPEAPPIPHFGQPGAQNCLKRQKSPRDDGWGPRPIVKQMTPTAICRCKTGRERVADRWMKAGCVLSRKSHAPVFGYSYFVVLPKPDGHFASVHRGEMCFASTTIICYAKSSQESVSVSR